MRLDAASAGRLAALALACVGREFPNRPGHVMQHAGELDRPRSLHPAFFGCFDWHSAVHGHWLLAHLLRRFPSLPQAGAIRSTLDSTLSVANLKIEAEYLRQHPEFERPYGWAWALKLAQERGNLQPLEAVIVQAYKQWLPRQTYPIRSGTHTNTAFGLAFALDHAHPGLKPLLIQRAIDYFGNDRDYPAAWEPGGNDFFSPCLIEADLMRRVLPDFRGWFDAFLPEVPASLLEPVQVSDRNDGQLAHLDGLNLSRAWCYFSLARALPERAVLGQAAVRHLEAGLSHIPSGSYAGEHWLATFAVYALACASEGG